MPPSLTPRTSSTPLTLRVPQHVGGNSSQPPAGPGLSLPAGIHGLPLLLTWPCWAAHMASWFQDSSVHSGVTLGCREMKTPSCFSTGSLPSSPGGWDAPCPGPHLSTLRQGLTYEHTWQLLCKGNAPFPQRTKGETVLRVPKPPGGRCFIKCSFLPAFQRTWINSVSTLTMLRSLWGSQLLRVWGEQPTLTLSLLGVHYLRSGTTVCPGTPG